MRNYNPGWDDPHRASMFYSLDIGNVHITMTDTETAIDTADVDPEQQAWIKADLATANANRAVRPWIVVAGHRPMYCTDGNPTKDKDCVFFAKILRDLVEDVYIDAKVDLVVAAHMHGWVLALVLRDNAAVLNDPTLECPIALQLRALLANGALQRDTA